MRQWGGLYLEAPGGVSSQLDQEAFGSSVGADACPE